MIEKAHNQEPTCEAKRKILAMDFGHNIDRHKYLYVRLICFSLHFHCKNVHENSFCPFQVANVSSKKEKEKNLYL